MTGALRLVANPMRHSFRFELLAAMLAGLIVALPAAAAEQKGQIYQQRAADGRIVLTDRPSATAVTERTWQVDREDKEAAQKRAFDVRKEADAVSERIQRRMEAQERLLAAAEQDRLAQQRMRDQQMARYDDGSYYPSYYAPGPYTNQPFRFRNTEPPFFEIGTHKNRFTPPPKRSHNGSRSGGKFSAPAMP